MVQKRATLSMGRHHGSVAVQRRGGVVSALALRQRAWDRSECPRAMAGRQRARSNAWTADARPARTPPVFMYERQPR